MSALIRPFLSGQFRSSPALFTASTHLFDRSQQVRNANTKHWNPKFKKLRAAKVIKINIPDMHEDLSTMSKEQIRSKMRQRGIEPRRHWLERPYTLASTSGVFEQYVPPEGDGKMSPVTKAGALQQYEWIKGKGKSFQAIRKIRNYEDEFDSKVFAQEAQDIYIAAHEALAAKNKIKLREFVTELAYPNMRHNTTDKTIHWRFIRSLEPPRVVHARVTPLIEKENEFGQVTVRFHTQQQLTIYDRFGRLIHGSEILAKDVLEYVVFEKHLANEYGTWRLHDKIVPDWMPPKPPGPRTYRVDDPPEPEPAPQVEDAVQVAPESTATTTTATTEEKKPLATA